MQDANGVWWKRCMICAEWTRYDQLMYERPTKAYPCGLDICQGCAEESVNEVEANKIVTILLGEEAHDGK